MKNEEPTAYHYLSCCRSIEECHCGKYPKQIKCYCGHTTTCDCSPIDEPKQETLEESAERIAMTKDWDFESSEGNGYYDYVEGFTEGAKSDAARDYWYAKWQQERRYSEEEVRNLFRNYQYDSAQFAAIMEGDTDGKPTPTGWFEKFKKK